MGPCIFFFFLNRMRAAAGAREPPPRATARAHRGIGAHLFFISLLSLPPRRRWWRAPCHRHRRRRHRRRPCAGAPCRPAMTGGRPRRPRHRWGSPSGRPQGCVALPWRRRRGGGTARGRHGACPPWWCRGVATQDPPAVALWCRLTVTRIGQSIAETERTVHSQLLYKKNSCTLPSLVSPH